MFDLVYKLNLKFWNWENILFVIFFFLVKLEFEFDNKFWDVIILNIGIFLRILVIYKGFFKFIIIWGKDEKFLKVGGSVILDIKDIFIIL